MSSTTPSPFGTHFPVNCPPSSATDTYGEYFRLVTVDPPADIDWKTHAEQGKATRADPCKRCGLSIYANPEDARANYLRVIERFGLEGTRIGSLIARLALQPVHGRAEYTPNERYQDSHHTWWPYFAADRPGTFVEIVEDAKNALGS